MVIEVREETMLPKTSSAAEGKWLNAAQHIIKAEKHTFQRRAMDSLRRECKFTKTDYTIFFLKNDFL